MSDPAVIADRERYAEVGREYRELQPAQRAGARVPDPQGRPRGRPRAARGRRRRGAAEGRRGGAGAARGARGGDPAGDGRARPERRQERDRRDPGRHRRRRGGAVRRRPLQDAHPLRRGARLLDRGPLPVAGRGRRLQGGHLRDQGRGRLLGLQVRGRHPPGPAGAGDRVAGPDPHLDRDRRGAARGRGGRGRGRPERPPDRRLPLLRARAASRSTRPTRRCGSPTSRPGSSSRCRTRSRSCRTRRGRCGCCARACYERELAEQQAKIAAERKAQVGTGERSEKIRTYNFPQGRVTDHRIKLTSHNLDGVLAGELCASSPRRSPPRRSAQRLEAAGRRAALRPMAATAAAGSGRRGARRRGRRARRRRGRDAAPRRRAAARRGDRVGPRARSPPIPGAAFRRPPRGASAAMVRRRLRREPVAYILGRKGLSADRARGRPAGAGAAPGDRAAGRAGARAAAGDGARRRHRLGRDRAGDRRRAAGCELTATDTSAGGARGRARQRRAARPRRAGRVPSRLAPAGRASFDLVVANLPYVARARLAARWQPEITRVGAARGAARRRRRPRRDPRLARRPLGAGRRAGAGAGRPTRSRSRSASGQAAAVAATARDAAGFDAVEVRRDLAGDRARASLGAR